MSCSWLDHDPKPLFLAGPTAVGKSAIALVLANKLQGEIISIDSMQVYRGLRIGTAKPLDAELRQVPHHLLDLVELNQGFNAGQFATEARRAGGEIQRRQRVPILCGGSGLYFQAILEGVGNAAPADPELRQQLETVPLPALLEELQRRDPESYQAIDRANRRRVMRAVEVARISGESALKPRSHWHRRGGSERNDQTPPAKVFFVALRRSRDDLHARIARRVERMFEAGLVTETQELLRAALPQSHGAWQAIGYKQVFAYLQHECSLDAAIEAVKLRTRQYAKRQMTWFNRQTDVQWLDLVPDETDDEVATKISAAYRQFASLEGVGTAGETRKL